MTRPRHKLTARFVSTITTPGRYSDGGGLALIVDGHGKRWVWRYKRGSRGAEKATELGLGILVDVSLARARSLADEMREAVSRGLDPRAVRQAAQGPTFGEIADAYVKTHRDSWKNEKHRQQWETTFHTYAASLRPIPIDKVDRAAVLSVLTPLWQRVPETAGRVRGRIEQVLDAAAAKGLRSNDNPARWKGGLKHLLPAPRKLVRGHMAAVPYREMPETIARLREFDSISARALEFCILTAARTSEVRGLVWSELDMAEAVWTIPPARMKSGREHRVPLSARALEIVQAMPVIQGSPFVFPGLRVGDQLSLSALLECVRWIKRGLTVHGFRSTFRDWVGDCTNHPREIAEAALAHVIGDKAEQAYRRSDALDRRRSF